MPFICGVDHRVIAAGSLSITTGIAVFTTYKWLSERRRKAQSNVYESEKLVNEYLAFHFANEKNIRLDLIPASALDFPKRCADLCLKHSETLLKVCLFKRIKSTGLMKGRLLKNFKIILAIIRAIFSSTLQEIFLIKFVILTKGLVWDNKFFIL